MKSQIRIQFPYFNANSRLQKSEILQRTPFQLHHLPQHQRDNDRSFERAGASSTATAGVAKILRKSAFNDDRAFFDG